MIKFQNEDMMKKWAAGLDQQRKLNAPQLQRSPDNDSQYFRFVDMQGVENPYKEDDEDEDEDGDANGSISGSTLAPSQYSASVPMPGTLPRNASSSSLRHRSATSESSHSHQGLPRAAPPRFPMNPPNIQTQVQGLMSPGPAGDPSSFFSPVSESPASSRTSTTSGIFSTAGYPFPKTATPQPWNPDEVNRYTAPAMPRASSRDGSSPANAFGANGRNPRGPSMPVMPRDSAQAQLQQQRSRSYSTPDINGQAARGGQSIPAVPGIPPHLNHPPHAIHARHDSSIPRSNTGSPANDLPLRANTNSPATQRARQPQYGGGTVVQFPTQPVQSRQGTPSNAINLPPPGPPPPGMAPLAPVDPSRTIAPGLPTAPLFSSSSSMSPGSDVTMLKVRVNYEAGNYFTLVVQFNTAYQSLIDRIDVKLARLTNSSIAKGDLKLRYRDEDGDFVTIESDDDIQIAISEWREGNPAGLGEIELFCVGDLS